MPAGDRFIVLAAHPGQGRYMLQTIDPAVVDQANPLLSDDAWDMYNPANGYRPFPEASAYPEEWVAEYRARQRERVARLDVVARGYVAEQAHFRKVMGVETDDEESQAMVARRGTLGGPFPRRLGKKGGSCRPAGAGDRPAGAVGRDAGVVERAGTTAHGSLRSERLAMEARIALGFAGRQYVRPWCPI